MENHKAPLFEFAHTRIESQRARMEECMRLGICPFCWEHLERWHDAPVIAQGKFWIITANDHVYQGTQYHYLAIYKDHISSIREMENGAGNELFSLFGEFCDKNKIPGETIFIRTGNMKYTGATVFHLHAHLVSGASRDEISNPDDMENWITAKIGYKKTDPM